MSEDLKNTVLRAVLRLLTPLVRLLLDAGIGVGEFHQLAKTAYVRAARDAAQEPRPNFSRIAVLTGIPRGEVAKILRRADEKSPKPERGEQRAERVLEGWWTDPKFLGSSGRPLRLPLRGSRRSFTALVKKYAGDPRVMTILKELLRVRAVSRSEDDIIEVRSRNFATVRWDASGIDTAGEAARDLLEALVHNLRHPGRPHFVRFVGSSRIDPHDAPMLIRNFSVSADVLAESFDNVLSDPKHLVRATKAPQQAHRIRIGIFVTDEPTLVEPSLATP